MRYGGEFGLIQSTAEETRDGSQHEGDNRDESDNKAQPNQFS